MTDPELIEKKLAQIETYIRELRTAGRPAQILNDIRQERFVEHTLQLAIQSALDVASHIVSDERLGEPRTNRELFKLLERAGWVDSQLASILDQMAGFRNVLVHGYDKVDLRIVEDIVVNRLDDLLKYVGAIRGRLSAPQR